MSSLPAESHRVSAFFGVSRSTAERREALLREIREELRQWADIAIALEPFPHGSFFDQMGHELVSVRVEQGDPLATQRRQRRNMKIKPSVRQKIYRGDDYRCRTCGWTPPVAEEARKTAYREGLHLTIDHVIPRSRGGSNRIDNLQTLCSNCNQAKGKLIEDPPLARDPEWPLPEEC